MAVVGAKAVRFDADEDAHAAAGAGKRRERRPVPVRVAEIRLAVDTVDVERVGDGDGVERRGARQGGEDRCAGRHVPVDRGQPFVVDVDARVPAAAVRAFGVGGGLVEFGVLADGGAFAPGDGAAPAAARDHARPLRGVERQAHRPNRHRRGRRRWRRGGGGRGRWCRRGGPRDGRDRRRRGGLRGRPG